MKPRRRAPRPWVCGIYGCDEPERDERGHVGVRVRGKMVRVEVCRVHFEAILLPIGRAAAARMERR